MASSTPIAASTCDDFSDLDVHAEWNSDQVVDEKTLIPITTAEGLGRSTVLHNTLHIFQARRFCPMLKVYYSFFTLHLAL